MKNAINTTANCTNLYYQYQNDSSAQSSHKFVVGDKTIDSLD
jgi:hypothetical protein